MEDQLILAIDPGTEKSAFVLFDTAAFTPSHFGIWDNATLRAAMLERVDFRGARLILEKIASYGMPVGAEIFETCFWTGRFIECHGGRYAMITRIKVKSELCHSAKATDSNIRQAILDLFPRTGGGKTPQIGIKKQPGPLFGVAEDVWAALGVAITGMQMDRRGDLAWFECAQLIPTINEATSELTIFEI